MNKLLTKITAIGLCAAISVGAAGAACAQEEKANTKDETVYVLASADGLAEKIIVSDWIQNAANADSITDSSKLLGIENVKGDESFTRDGDLIVWNAEGNDIYYQGTADKELPVTLSVSCQLDGQPISAEELAGKSGRVTIRFDYENHVYETVDINGTPEKIYVPFCMMTGMLLDNDIFRNVEVVNGKLVNDGDRSIVIGAAFPGMQENLGMDAQKLEIPDYVEITADVTDFALGMTVTVATNELFNDLSLPDEFTGELDPSGELAADMEKLAEGVRALADGSVSLDDGAAQLADGAQKLSEGLNMLASNNVALNDGAKQVFDTFLTTADAQIKAAGLEIPALTVENYTEVLDGVLASLDETVVYNQALAQVTAAVEENRPVVIQKVTAAVREQVEAQVVAAVREQVSAGVAAAVKEQVTAQVIQAAAGMAKADYEAAAAAGMVSEDQRAAIAAAIESQMETEDVKALIEANIAAQMDSDEMKATIAANTEAQMQTEAVKNTVAENVEQQIAQLISQNMASDAVQEKLTAAAQGAQSITALQASLDSYNTFYQGLLAYTDGVAEAATGAETLSAGASELKAGTAQLKEGIQRITALMDGDLNNLLTRIRATVETSRHYTSFSGISDAMNGQVKFIYRTNEI